VGKNIKIAESQIRTLWEIIQHFPTEVL